MSYNKRQMRDYPLVSNLCLPKLAELYTHVIGSRVAGPGNGDGGLRPKDRVMFAACKRLLYAHDYLMAWWSMDCDIPSVNNPVFPDFDPLYLYAEIEDLIDILCDVMHVLQREGVPQCEGDLYDLPDDDHDITGSDSEM